MTTFNVAVQDTFKLGQADVQSNGKISQLLTLFDTPILLSFKVSHVLGLTSRPNTRTDQISVKHTLVLSDVPRPNHVNIGVLQILKIVSRIVQSGTFSNPRGVISKLVLAQTPQQVASVRGESVTNQLLLTPVQSQHRSGKRDTGYNPE